jgi:hypothetical protein
MLTSKVAIAPRGDVEGIIKNIYWCQSELKTYHISERETNQNDCGIPKYIEIWRWKQLIGVYDSKCINCDDMVLL